MVELLKQGRFIPMPVENQVMAIFAGTKGFLDDIAVEDIQAFRDGFLEYVNGSHSEISKAIVSDQKITDETEAKLKAVLGEYKGIFASDSGE